MFSRLRCLVLMLVFLIPLVSVHAATSQKAKPQMPQNERWNLFFKQVYALHKKQIKGHKIRTITGIDGYRDDLKFYKEVQFFDANSGQHLSTIQWERRKPYLLHTVLVNVYSKQGKLLREYISAYLPVHRAAPVQTLVNFHASNGKLKAFRQFDASGYLTYESCKGQYRGKKVDISLDEDDLYDAEKEPGHVVHTASYKACFAGVAKKPGLYLHPQ